MIDAKELRLGNWVERLDGSQFQITASDIELISRITPQLTPNPIILTPEVLEACGFEITTSQAHNITHAYNGYLALNTYTKGGEFWWLRYYQGGTNAKIKYLHQLQNLLFDLCGQELEYKNK